MTQPTRKKVNGVDGYYGPGVPVGSSKSLEEQIYDIALGYTGARTLGASKDRAESIARLVTAAVRAYARDRAGAVAEQIRDKLYATGKFDASSPEAYEEVAEVTAELAQIARSVAEEVAEKMIDTPMPPKYIRPENALRGAQRQALPGMLDEVIGGKQ